MTARRRTAAWVAAAALVLAVTAAQAGQRCEPQRASATDITQALALGQRSAEALDHSGARVALIGRAGQDLSAYGLRWSHLAFAYRDEPAGAWRVLHKLNHCGSEHSALYRQGLADFFMDRPWRYEAAIVALEPSLQQALLPLLRDNARAATLHGARYSMVAYPWSTRYQQSNQWALETLALAQAPQAVASREDAQRWLRTQGFAPTTLRLPALQRLGARVTAANVSFDDHPPQQRFAGRIDTVTVESVFTFVRAQGMGSAPQIVR